MENLQFLPAPPLAFSGTSVQEERLLLPHEQVPIVWSDSPHFPKGPLTLHKLLSWGLARSCQALMFSLQARDHSAEMDSLSPLGPHAASPGAAVRAFGSPPGSKDTSTPQVLLVPSPLAPQGIVDFRATLV